MYGAQPPKIAETLGVSLKVAKELFDRFWKDNPALNSFKQSVLRIYNQRGGKNGGYLIGLDGRKIFIRSPHSAVNAMFQSAGSIIVKTSMCYLWSKWVPDEHIRAKLLIQQHDEFQAEVYPDDTDRYVELALKSFIKTGEYYNINVPIVGDAMIGKNWSETH